MPYRRHGEVLEVPTAGGALRIELGPDSIELRLADHSVRIAQGSATVHAGDQIEVFPITGRVALARNVLRGDVAIWLERECGGMTTMRRLFGAAPISLLDPGHASSLRLVDEASRRLHTALRRLSGDFVRVVEIGTGRNQHKLLVAELPDRHLVFACRLFRAQAELVMTVFDEGRIAFLHHPHEIRVDSRLAVSVHGDQVRFTDRYDIPLARVSIPCIAPEDRMELARRIGELVARSAGALRARAE